MYRIRRHYPDKALWSGRALDPGGAKIVVSGVGTRHIAVTKDYSDIALECIVAISKMNIVYGIGCDRNGLEEDDIRPGCDWTRKSSTG
jgi:hypothetical protein